MDVLVEVVHLQVSHRGDAALGQGRVSLVESGLADQRHAAVFGGLEGERHAGDAAAYHKKVIFTCHDR